MAPLRCLLLLGLTACSSAQGAPLAFATRDSAGVAVAENAMELVTATCVVDSLPTIRIGGVEDDDDRYLFRSFGGSRLSDGRIAVVNQSTSEVRWYDSTGALVGRSGRQGKGPGEFTDAFLMARLPGDTLWVGDYRPWQWHIFGPDMRFVRTVQNYPTQPNSPGAFAIFDDGQQLFGSEQIAQRVSWAMQYMTIGRYRPDGTLRDTVLTIPTGHIGQTTQDPSAIWMRPWFEGSAELEGRGQRFVVSTWDAPEVTVYEVGEAVTPAMVIRWTTGDRSVSSQAVEEARTREANRYPDLSPEMKHSLLDPLVDPARPVADHYPAVTGLVLGQDGRIWVRGYSPADAPTAPWIAFSSTGQAVCRAELPRLTIYEIGADYVLAHRRNVDGVETVESFVLHGPVKE
jgi:hypothetical protein